MLSLLLLLACDPSDISEKGADDTDDTPADTDDTPADTDTQPADTDDTTEEPSDESPAVCINEYMNSNSTALVLPDGTAPDWIELHNPTANAINLGGWWITDDPAVPDKHVLPSNLRIRAGEFLLLYADDDVEDGEDHVGFSLDKEGETLRLTDPDGKVEVVEVGLGTTDFSTTRIPDCCTGAGCWSSVSLGTPGTTNGTR